MHLIHLQNWISILENRTSGLGTLRARWFYFERNTFKRRGAFPEISDSKIRSFPINKWWVIVMLAWDVAPSFVQMSQLYIFLLLVDTTKRKRIVVCYGSEMRDGSVVGFLRWERRRRRVRPTWWTRSLYVVFKTDARWRKHRTRLDCRTRCHRFHPSPPGADRESAP